MTWSKDQNSASGPLQGVFGLAISTLESFNVNFAAKLPTESVEKRDVNPLYAAQKSDILEKLSNLNQDAHDYFITGLEVGCRLPGELNALQWSDYHGKKYVHIHKSIVRRKVKGTKTHRDRKVYLTPDAIAVLESKFYNVYATWIRSDDDESELAKIIEVGVKTPPETKKTRTIN